VGELQGSDELVFRDFLGPGLDHDDGVFGTSHDQLELAVLRHHRVEHETPVLKPYAY